MSDKAAQPDDELTQAIRNAILAGAAEGAEATARRIAAAASTGLDEVTAVLQALAAEAAPQAVTGSLSVSLPTASVSVMTHVRSVHVAAAELSGEGTLGVSRADVAAAALSGFGTLGVGAADVAAAADELRVIRQPDVEEPAGQPPVRWTKPELVLNSRGRDHLRITIEMMVTAPALSVAWRGLQPAARAMTSPGGMRAARRPRSSRS
jgi:hypothetical protein